MTLVRSLGILVAMAICASVPVRSAEGDAKDPWWAPRIRAKDAVGTETAEKAGDDATDAKPPAPAPTTAPTKAAPAPAPAKAAPTAAPVAAAAPGPSPATAPAPAPAAGPAAVTAAPAAAAAAAAAAAPATVSPAPPPAAPPPPILPDASLKTTIDLVRKSPIGQEPNAVAYLDLMTTGGASAAQVNDFAAYVAKRGMPKVALAFQQYALRLDPKNPSLWQNLGTIQRTAGSLGDAATSFKKAIALNPIDALAHYNLGAVYDAQGSYDAALEEYRRALVLQPDLADPRKNPQVVNNDNLLAVELQIYRDHAGSLGLPLLQLQKPAAQPKAAAAKP